MPSIADRFLTFIYESVIYESIYINKNFICLCCMNEFRKWISFVTIFEFLLNDKIVCKPMIKSRLFDRAYLGLPK